MRTPPTRPEDIQIFMSKAPGNVECYQIAAVSAVSRHSLQSAMDRVKREAAKVGANAVIVTQCGSRYGGSVAYAFGNASTYARPYSANTFATGTAFAAPVYLQCVGGIAVYATPRDSAYDPAWR